MTARLRFLLGRAGTGKTYHCLQAIRTELKKTGQEGPPLILLTPEQATFQMERALLADDEVRATSRARVLSFQRLGAYVMQHIGGGAKPRLGELGKRMLLRALIQRRDDDLTLFRQAAGQPGFIDRLAGTLTELRQYNVGPDDLARRLEDVADELPVLGAKMADLHLVYDDFIREVDEQFTDPDDVLNVVADALPKSGLFQGAYVWVDGFAGFTPQEFNVLRALWTIVERMDVALCLEPAIVGAVDGMYVDAPAPGLFAPTVETFTQLTEMAREERVRVDEPVVFTALPPRRFAKSERLTHLERELFRRPGRPYKASETEEAPESLRIVAAAGLRVEVEAAARQILHLSRERGWRFRDMAVIVHDLEPYEDLISSIFQDLNIPYFIDSRRTLTHHPLTELVRSLLEAYASGWHTDSVIRCFKTDFFPLSRDEVDRLENYALEHGISGRGWIRKEPWQYVRHFTLEPEEPRLSADQRRHLQEMNDIRDRAVAPLRQLARALESATCGRDWAVAVWDVLEQLNVAVTLERWMELAEAEGRISEVQEHERAWQGVLQLLDELVNALGETPMSVAEFRQIVEAGLESLRVGMVPASLDQVMVGTVERSRQPDIKAAFVLGAADKHFPPPPAEDVIFTDGEREQLAALKLQLSPTSKEQSLRQQFLLYISLTRASEYLWVSYPSVDGQGKEQKPAATLRRLLKLFPDNAVVTEVVDPQEDESLLERIVTSDDLIATTGLRLARHKAGETASAVWWRLYEWIAQDETLRGRALPLFAALDYRNRMAPLPKDVAKELFGTPLHSSVSRLETFAACPFRHFAQYGLRLRERPRWQLDAAAAGTFVHAALRRFVERLAEDDLDWGALNDDEAAVLADECVAQLTPRLSGEILLSSARHEFLAQLLRMTVRRAVWALTEHARQGRFRPVVVEASFGRGEAVWPAFVIDLGDGEALHLSGQIDRVDVAEDDDGTRWVRIIDYKSSDHSLPIGRVVEGLSLQLPLYMAVVTNGGVTGAGQSSPLQPSGLLYFPVRDPILRRDTPVSEKEWEGVLRRVLRMRGLFIDEVPVLRLMDARIDAGSDLVMVEVTKAGRVAKRSNKASRKQFDQLLTFARKKAAQFGKEILAGKIDISPYRIGNERACYYCPFKSVCQFDPLIEGNAYRKLQPLAKEQAWEHIDGAVT